MRSPTEVTHFKGRPAAILMHKFKLEVLRNGQVADSLVLSQRRTRVGSREGNDLLLVDESVSRSHCELTVDERGYRLRDLGSTNGTLVGGHHIVEIYLNPNTVFSVGRVPVRFVQMDDKTTIPLSDKEIFGQVLGRSVAMREIFSILERVSPTDLTLLVEGETGTGKELVARAVHEHSPRREGPYVVVDCAAMPATLIESELFGHEKGAFTGAFMARPGAFECAKGGTIFLDEIGELSMDLQPKMLRVLEMKEIKRLGSSKPVKLDVRVLAATNRDLAMEVRAGRFREDLFFRLAAVMVRLPPLRERREDIPLLVEHFINMLPPERQRPLSPATLAQLVTHPWRGNVREIRATIERAAALAMGQGDLTLPPLSPSRSHPPAEAMPIHGLAVDASIPYKEAKERLLKAFERAYLSALLETAEGNISEAARRSGLNRMSIHKMLRRLGLRKDDLEE